MLKARLQLTEAAYFGAGQASCTNGHLSTLTVSRIKKLLLNPPKASVASQSEGKCVVVPDSIDLPSRIERHCVRNGSNDTNGRAITWRVTAENNPYLRGANECRVVLTPIRFHPRT
jgi:hypothetical protein